MMSNGMDNRGSKWFASLLGLAFVLGASNAAQAQLGACAHADGSCDLSQSELTCTTALGTYQGDGTTACQDCDCNGDNDAKEIADCADACVLGGGVLAACEVACSDGSTPARPAGCDPSMPILFGGKCCDPDTGLKAVIADAYGCTIDACEAGGTPSHTADDTVCGDASDDGVNCTSAVCNVDAGCEAGADDAAGAACGNPNDVGCDAADSCGDAGACINRVEPTTTECRASSDECDPAEFCGGGTDLGDGQGPEVAAGWDCAADVLEDDGSACGAAPAGACDLADSCCSGVCTDIVASVGVECRAAADDCDVAETCTGGVPGCGFGNEESGAASKECPTDGFESAGTNCGNAASDDCDKQDKCDGSGVCEDKIRPDGYTCRAAAGVCDVDEDCDGVAKACPSDVLLTTECRANPNAAVGIENCGIAEFCDGVLADCPADTFVAADTECRSAGADATCDPSEVCTGASSFCPSDAVAAFSCANLCDDGDACTNVDICQGDGTCGGGGVDQCGAGSGLVDCSDALVCNNDECDSDTGCYHDYVDSFCGDLLVKTVADDEAFQGGCLSVEVWVVDSSADSDGINCAFTRINLGSAACPLTITSFDVSDNFPDFQSGWHDPDTTPASRILDFGGCTNDSGVGAGQYVLLGTMEVVAATNECTASLGSLQASLTSSSLIGQGAKTAIEDTDADTAIGLNCWSDLYDHAPSSEFIDAADLSYFSECWMMAAAPDCEDFDYNEDGTVDEMDLSFFSTAWQQNNCSGQVVIPSSRFGCMEGGLAGLQLDSDGLVREVDVQPASRELIESLGLSTTPARRSSLRTTGKAGVGARK